MKTKLCILLCLIPNILQANILNIPQNLVDVAILIVILNVGIFIFILLWWIKVIRQFRIESNNSKLIQFIINLCVSFIGTIILFYGYIGESEWKTYLTYHGGDRDTFWLFPFVWIGLFLMIYIIEYILTNFKFKF